MRINNPSGVAAQSDGGFGEPFPEGDYEFEILEAKDKRSSTGNEMVEVRMFIFSPTGAKRTVFDYLVNTQGGLPKVRGACEATGLLKEFLEGEIKSYMFEGQRGRAHVGIEHDSTGRYPSKNKIARYIPNPGSTASAYQAKATQKPLEDEIPF